MISDYEKLSLSISLFSYVDQANVVVAGDFVRNMCFRRDHQNLRGEADLETIHSSITKRNCDFVIDVRGWAVYK